MNSPVAIFVYNRPEHTKKTILALSKNFLAKETDVIIFSDNYKSLDSKNSVLEVREHLKSSVIKTYFKSLRIVYSNKNRGLAKSIINGVTEIINEYKTIIVLEDDLVTSKDYLTFMNDALIFFEESDNVWSISGYTFLSNIPKNYKSNIYLSYRASSWGWATWKAQWDSVDWDVKNYNEFINNKTSINTFNIGGRDLTPMLENQMNNKIDSWAIRWCYSQFQQKKITIYPIESKVINIGLDGTGTHSGVTSKYDTNFGELHEKYNFEFPAENKIIIRRSSNHFMTPTRSIVIRIKKLIKRFLRYE